MTLQLADFAGCESSEMCFGRRQREKPGRSEEYTACHGNARGAWSGMNGLLDRAQREDPCQGAHRLSVHRETEAIKQLAPQDFTWRFRREPAFDAGGASGKSNIAESKEYLSHGRRTECGEARCA
jgi:hypothetical protein